LLLAPGDPDTALNNLENPGPLFGEDPQSSRDRLLLTTLAKAFAECAERMGGDASKWQWGRLHHGYFEHALTPLDRKHGVKLDVGPLPMGGGDSTTMNTTYRHNDFRVVLGASVRVVVDVGEWDNSMCINAPGQSGDPRSPHYADLAEQWSRGEYIPMLYSREAVDKAAERQITLKPRRKDG
jgi:penicillin amidase